jgi:membrane dipeptidase
MSISTRYSGYTSYSYLRPGVDYEAFELAAELGREKPYEADLTADQRDRAARLVDESVVVSLHDHPVVYPRRPDEFHRYNRAARQHTGYAGLARSGMTAVVDNLMDGEGLVTSSAGWKWDEVVYDLAMRLCDLAHQDYAIVGRSVDDIIGAHRDGRLAVVFGLESATPLENEIDRLDMLYGLGIRQVGIAYSEANALGSGLKEDRDGGLTRFGRRCVERMNRLGMAIDLSHAGDQTSLDTIAASEKPVLITHAGARGVWNSPRMKPDEVVTACASKGGVLGIEAAPHSTLSPHRAVHDLEAVMDHFRYLVDLVGIDHVGFGPDTLFGDHNALQRVFTPRWDHGSRPMPQHQEEPPYVAGAENPAETFPNITAWLVSHDYSDEDIRKVIGGNALRVLREIW